MESKKQCYIERVVQGREKGRGEKFPWGEKLSVPRRLQTHRSPVISLLPGSLLTAPWLRRLDSFIHTHTQSSHTYWLIHSCHNTFKFYWHTVLYTLVLILTFRMHVCDTLATWSIYTVTLEKVPLLQVGQGQLTVSNCCSWATGLNRGSVLLAAAVVVVMMLIMMMTYLSHYSSAQGRGTQRQIPPDDEFISAKHEMSSQAQGCVWVICVLCSKVLDQTWDQLGRLVVNLPTLLVQDFGTFLSQAQHPSSPSWYVCPLWHFTLTHSVWLLQTDTVVAHFVIWPQQRG